MVNKEDQTSKEREPEAGKAGEGEKPCCDAKVFMHGHAKSGAFRRGWHRTMHGAGACCGPTPVQVNIMLPENFSCCPPSQDCCTEEECCSEEQPATDK
jgi:hypothetical protein